MTTPGGPGAGVASASAVGGLRRFSSRLVRLDHAFLRDRLRGARQYDRIAGYFRSSIFEVAAEELQTVGRIRVVCNSDLNPEDLKASKEARSSAMLQRWWADRAAGDAVELDTLLRGDRYARLKQMLEARDGDGRPRVDIKVVDRFAAPLLHGKAGIITLADGGKCCFMGSVNETRDAWQNHYELLWEDSSEEGIAWTQAEFDFLWSQAVDLPDAVIQEVERCAGRVEIRIEDCPAWSLGTATDLPRAALAESPLARAGEGLQPWQKSFVAEFLRHREIYGKARLLLADEVGVGKTLSLATGALLTALMGDGPALILAPSTLTQQWQVELWDRLGVPSARLSSVKKVWIDHHGHTVRTSGASDIVRCPFRVAIVSTGLLMQMSEERRALLSKRAARGETAYGMVVLDEAHRARGALDRETGERRPQKLLSFMLEIAPKSRHVLLGTATPIQTDQMDLWDLIQILASGADHVLGNQFSSWRNNPATALKLVTGEERPQGEAEAWPWLSNPLPPGREHTLFDHIRTDLGLKDGVFATAESYTALDDMITREELRELLAQQSGLGFLQQHNPVVRHVVLRRRKSLEEAGLMKPVAVEIHPREPEPERRTRIYFGATGRAVETSHALREAFEEAERYTKAMMARNKGAGFMRSLLLQRICSSTTAGLATARALANPAPEAKQALAEALEDEDGLSLAPMDEPPSPTEAESLKRLTELLETAVAEGDDPKFKVTRHYLRDRGWLELGCIVFSQYFDTAQWVAATLARELPSEPIALYAGAGKSGVHRDGKFNAVQRDSIKTAVRERSIRLVIATDAACEGLNLQTLGTLIDVDLPWNPSRLEQRIGRIKRFGQSRDVVDMLNLIYEGSRDEAIYDKLSERMKDRFDIFGQLPDVLSDDWIDDVQGLEKELRKFVEGRQRANAFDARWGNTATGISMSAAEREWQRGWQTCRDVLSRRDIEKRLGEGW
jgi:superfamily II DNA or RNA helicase